MKLAIVFLAVVGAVLSADVVPLAERPVFDLSNVRPLYEIPEFRAMHPEDFTGRVAPRTSGSRIINGNLAGATDVPYQVALMLSFSSGSGFCSGALISRTTVLTSGSCSHNVPAATALLGATDLSRPSEIIPVSQIIVHPNYGTIFSGNDIGLMRLMRPANLNAEVGIARLPLRRQEGQVFSGMSGRVTGWGSTGLPNENVPVNNLRFVRLQTISNLVCTISFPAYIRSNNICTETGPSTPCTGDEGGPLTIVEADGIDTLIGIHSYTFSLSCTLGWPAVFTRTTSYLDWIRDNSDVIIQP